MATNSRTAISLAELKAVASSLQSQKDTMYSLYKNNIVSILESTRNSFKSTYTELNRRYEELINVLNNDIIAGYTELTSAIVQLFNKDFASKFNQLLGTK